MAGSSHEGSSVEQKVVELPVMECAHPRYHWAETPSMKNGLTEADEADLRAFGCSLIQQSGSLLEEPQVVMACAQILFQRFYCRKSFLRHPIAAVATASLFLAAKVEEEPRRIRDVINVTHHIIQKISKACLAGRQPEPMHSYGDAYIDFKAEVIAAERRLLKELGFCVHVPHPHKLISSYLTVLGLNETGDLAQCAWSYMNDALRSTVFVKYPLEAIACGCMHLAFCKLGQVMPQHWSDCFDVEEEAMKKVGAHIMALYKMPQRTIEELEAKILQAQKAENIPTLHQIAILPLPKEGDPKRDATASPKAARSPSQTSSPSTRRRSRSPRRRSRSRSPSRRRSRSPRRRDDRRDDRYRRRSRSRDRDRNRDRDRDRRRRDDRDRDDRYRR